jgi:hypothetical protein
MFRYEPERAIVETIRKHPIKMMAHKDIAKVLHAQRIQVTPFIDKLVAENILTERRLGGTRIVTIAQDD